MRRDSLTGVTDRSEQDAPRRVIVVGGGIAGLAAAWELSGGDGGSPPGRAEVLVLEGAPVVGGKLRTAEVAGHAVDVGAEAMLARRPEGVDLIRAVAPDEAVQHPARVPARVLGPDGLRSMPGGTLMGVPGDPRTLADLLGPDAAARADDRGRAWPPRPGDVSVGALLRERLGDGVVDGLVEPLLGGVYAGDPDALSLWATVPALRPAAERGDSLVDAVARVVGAAGGTRDDTAALPRPVFAGLAGGVGRLPALAADALGARGVRIRTDAPVRALHRSADGWELVVGSTRDAERVRADAVVLAVPAAPASRLLAEHAPGPAAGLGGVGYASMAVVTLAFAGRGAAEAVGGSGYLVPRAEGRRRGWDVKGVTVSSAKWPWLAQQIGDLTVLRGSIGRAGEERRLQREDAELVAALRRELAGAVGVALPEPVDAHVQRWGGGLPQYAVGHGDLVARVRDAAASLPGLHLAGAAYDGVGIPACIASGRAAGRAARQGVRADGAGPGPTLGA